MAMRRIDSVEEIKENTILPFGDDEECIVVFVINDDHPTYDVWVEKLGKRVLH